MIDSPGIYFDFDTDAYFSDPCPSPSLTQSIAKVMLDRSPAHAWLQHPRNPAFDPGKPSYTMDKAIGNAWHLLMLERGKRLALLPYDAMTTKEARERRDEAWGMGQEPILEKHFATALRMSDVAKLRLRDDYGIELEPNVGASEVVVAWEEDGYWFRTMIDFLRHDKRQVIDLKSVYNASPSYLPTKMGEDGYAIQSAFHARGLNKLDMMNTGRRSHLFVLQEKDPPYALSVLHMGVGVLTLGQQMVDYAIKIWRKCQGTGVYPSYPTSIQEPELPTYAIASWMNKLEEATRRVDRPAGERSLVSALDTSGGEA